MPELPEVETVKRIIEPQLTGRTVLAVCVSHPGVIAWPDAGAFAAALTGRAFTGMGRRGKFLLFSLDNGDRMALHLRMTGQALVTSEGFPPEKHTHLTLALSGGVQFRYTDPRRFGRFWYFRQGEADTATGMERLGPEPDDPILTAQYLRQKLATKNRPVKEMLHDQSVVAGIGNIYSDEILFSARIYPETRCADLNAEEWQRLAAAIPAVIAWGIETNSMTPEEYLAGKGREYGNMDGFRAYGRRGKPCSVCGTLMERTVICGRSSCYCPSCQKKRP